MRDQLNVWPLIVDEGVGKLDELIVSPAFKLLAATFVAMSVFSDLARRTAPSRFTSPAPCCTRLWSDSGWAVYWRMALTSGGVRPGFACSMTAAAPATTGAAIDVPLRSMCVSRYGCGMFSGVTSAA